MNVMLYNNNHITYFLMKRILNTITSHDIYITRLADPLYGSLLAKSRGDFSTNIEEAIINQSAI